MALGAFPLFAWPEEGLKLIFLIFFLCLRYVAALLPTLTLTLVFAVTCKDIVMPSCIQFDLSFSAVACPQLRYYASGFAVWP